MFTEGQIVKIKDYDRFPGANTGNAKILGKKAKVVGAYIKDDGTRCYQLIPEGFRSISTIMFTEDMLESPEVNGLHIGFETMDGKSIRATLYGADDEPIETGDAFIYHNDIEGFAQAASYAMKRLWCKLYDARKGDEDASLSAF